MKGNEINMEEKIYKTMAQTGGFSIALGVICIVTGIVVGVLTIVNGGRLLHNKSKILF
ncbi:MAG: hypothetical protein K6F53_04120 [Lachnospiraceae bacterium]|nr:hypothetical protein [Lachnospiraceae bacterium]